MCKDSNSPFLYRRLYVIKDNGLGCLDACALQVRHLPWAVGMCSKDERLFGLALTFFQLWSLSEPNHLKWLQLSST